MLLPPQVPQSHVVGLYYCPLRPSPIPPPHPIPSTLRSCPKIKFQLDQNVGDGNDFQSLNPGEKTRVCKKKIEEFGAESATLLSERQALEKMMDVYSQNTALGDPESIKEQLAVNAKRLDKSNEELHKYQVSLVTMLMFYYEHR